jgi:hypothetical protein
MVARPLLTPVAQKPRSCEPAERLLIMEYCFASKSFASALFPKISAFVALVYPHRCGVARLLIYTTPALVSEVLSVRSAKYSTNDYDAK